MGASSATSTLSTTISLGSVVPSSFTKTENSSASGWGSGTVSNTAVGISSITMLTNNSGTVTEPSFETVPYTDYWDEVESPLSEWLQPTITVPYACGTVSAQSGTYFVRNRTIQTSWTAKLEALDLSGSVIDSLSLSKTNICTWTQASLSPTSGNRGRRVKFRFYITSSDGINSITTKDSYIWGGPISFYYVINDIGSVTDSMFDNISGGSSTITTGSFTSQPINTGIPYSHIY